MKYLENYQYMVYNQSLDGDFCIYCALFASTENTGGKFVSKPFSKYHSIHEKARIISLLSTTEMRWLKPTNF